MEAIIQTIDHGLKPFTINLKREVTRDDIIKLTEIKIKRISRFDAHKADEYIADIFGSHYSVIDRIESLPQELPKLFLSLTK